MNQAFSGPQILYRAVKNEQAEIGKGHCRICGGPLLLPSKPAKQRSSSWTDENLCARRDEKNICKACAWFTEDRNRINFWQGQQVIFASQDQLIATNIPGLLAILESNFSTPAIFLVRGKDPQLARKHQQWRTIQAVTYSKEKVKIPFVGIQLFKEDKISGIAEFISKDFCAQTRTLLQLSETYLIPTLGKLKSDWAKQNTIFSHLITGLGDKMTPTNYLSAYIASNIAIYGEGEKNETTTLSL